MVGGLLHVSYMARNIISNSGISTRSSVNNCNYNIRKIVLKSALLLDRINVCHANIGSLLLKIDELRSMFGNSNAHVIVFSES